VRPPKTVVDGPKKAFEVSLRNRTNPRAVMAAWHGMVANYTSRALTKEEDKLPAIAGLARIFHGKIGGAYYAGLWGADLIHELMWRPNSINDCRPIVEPYLAPSWSWVALGGRVTWLDFPKEPDSYLAPDEIDVEVLEVHTSLAGPDSFGRILGGHIRLRARVVAVTYRIYYHGGKHGADKYACERDSVEGEMMPDLNPETLGQGRIPNGTALYCLRLGKVLVMSDKVWLPRFLVLRELEDRPGVFRRVGLLNMFPDEDRVWFEAEDRQDVLII
jgi:hypothetical protein